MPGSRIELLRGLERTLADCRSGLREFVSATQVSLSPDKGFTPKILAPSRRVQVAILLSSDCSDFVPLS